MSKALFLFTVVPDSSPAFRVRNKVLKGTLRMTGSEFPMFLYRDMDWDPDDIERGLCISEILFTVSYIQPLRFPSTIACPVLEAYIYWA